MTWEGVVVFEGPMISVVRFAARRVLPEELHPAIEALALGARIRQIWKNASETGAEGGDDSDDTSLDLAGVDL